jgi:type IV secretion system protein VirB9
VREKIIMMKKFLLFIISLLFVFNSANSVQLPRTIGKEKRFRAYIYNPNEVYRYVGYYLSQTYIEFEEGEVVKTISMGDTTAWQTMVMENKLFLKPVGTYPDTNMTVLTNKRTY